MIKNSFLKDGIPTVTPAELSTTNQIHMIDVRSNEEFTGELGHIRGAKLVTLGEDLSKFLNSSNKNETYVFICRSGARSGRATLEAQSKGFTNVYNMEGGMIAWNSANFPVER